jgi:hypothetical protein
LLNFPTGHRTHAPLINMVPELQCTVGVEDGNGLGLRVGGGLGAGVGSNVGSMVGSGETLGIDVGGRVGAGVGSLQRSSSNSEQFDMVMVALQLEDPQHEKGALLLHAVHAEALLRSAG